VWIHSKEWFLGRVRLGHLSGLPLRTPDAPKAVVSAFVGPNHSDVCLGKHQDARTNQPITIALLRSISAATAK
jgi:hypothetical protein